MLERVELSTMTFVMIETALETDGSTPILEDTFVEIPKIMPDLATKPDTKHVESSDLPESKVYAAFISHKKVIFVFHTLYNTLTFVFAFIRHTANSETQVQH
jgi:hypothetical protein